MFRTGASLRSYMQWGATGTATEDSSVQLLADCDKVSHRGDSDQARCQRPGGSHGDSGKRTVPLFAMESRRGGTSEGSAGSSLHQGCDPGGGPAASTHRSSQRGWEVPSSAQTDFGYAERCYPVDAGDSKPNSGIPDDLSVDRTNDPQRLHAPGSLCPPAFQVGQKPTGDSCRQDDPGALRPGSILQLQLSNPHEHSYSNCIIVSLLWVASCTPGGMSVPRNGLLRFLQWLSTQHKPQPVHSYMANHHAWMAETSAEA